MRIDPKTDVRCRVYEGYPQAFYFLPDEDGNLWPQYCDLYCNRPECQKCAVDALKKFIDELPPWLKT